VCISSVLTLRLVLLWLVLIYIKCIGTIPVRGETEETVESIEWSVCRLSRSGVYRDTGIYTEGQ